MAEINKRDSMEAGVSDMAKKLENTQITQEDRKDTASERTVNLTSLPPSVRNRIYSHLLDTELVNLGHSNVSYTHELKNNVLQFKASRPPFPVCTALFYTNKQISEESRHFFYTRNLWVRFEVYTADARHAKNLLEDSGVLFAVAREDAIARSQQHALDLTLVEKNSSQKRAAVMFPAQYLPRIINFMEQASRASSAWSKAHSLFLTLKRVPGTEIASVQGDLLEGFRALTGLSKAVIDGEDILPGYAEGLAASMTSATFDVEAWLNTLTTTLTHAQTSSRENNHKTSIQYCRTAIISLTHAYLTRPEHLHAQAEPIQKRIQRLRYHLEYTLSTSSFSLTSSSSSSSTSSQPLTNTLTPQTATALLTAESASTHALSLATDSPTPSSNPWYRSLPPELIPPNKAAWFTDAERARAWLALGKAHFALGECLFAAGGLERAVRMLGLVRDEEEGEARAWFERARGAIDWGVRPGRAMERAAFLAARGGGERG